jgi:serine/threonine protein kinase
LTDDPQYPRGQSKLDEANDTSPSHRLMDAKPPSRRGSRALASGVTSGVTSSVGSSNAGHNAAYGVLSEGSRFGAYVVGACIGQGGMARVYRAEHEGLQRQVALKVLSDGLGKDSDGHERFLREARIAAAIKHPNVVNIFDVGVHHGTPYLVMELLEGTDLDAYVETKGRLDEATIMDVIVPIAAGLAAVHDAGIVHRDLKPGNIFLARGRNDEIEPRLLDFGISKSSGPDQMKLTSARGLLLGTPFYMSPEAARGTEMTPLSDQYALGVVLYECATGVNPFTQATSFAEVVRRVTTGEFPPVASHNPLLSKRMVAIIERAMHLDPARRFPDIRAMGRELLVLAGQRTRVTWGLSFTDLIPRGALARVQHGSDGAMTGRQRQGKKSSRAWFALPAALGVVGLIGGSWAVDKDRKRARSELAATMPRTGSAPIESDSAHALALRPVAQPEPAPGALPAAAPRLLGQRLTEQRLAAADVEDTRDVGSRSEVEDSVNTATSTRAATPTIDLAVEMERALAKAPRAERRRVIRRTPAAAPKAQAAQQAEEKPEWISGRQASAPGSRGANRGTNNAPILD